MMRERTYAGDDGTHLGGWCLFLLGFWEERRVVMVISVWMD
jgi:hypothetical protein